MPSETHTWPSRKPTIKAITMPVTFSTLRHASFQCDPRSKELANAEPPSFSGAGSENAPGAVSHTRESHGSIIYRPLRPIRRPGEVEDPDCSGAVIVPYRHTRTGSNGDICNPETYSQGHANPRQSEAALQDTVTGDIAWQILLKGIAEGDGVQG